MSSGPNKRSCRWRIYLLNDARLRCNQSKLSACLRKIASAVRSSPALPRGVREINFLWTSNAKIKALNRKYRHKNKATDVLSFSQIEGRERNSPPSPLLGDIVISVEKARAQAKDFSGTFESEMLRLAIHGMLHLFGYDHEKSAREAKRMQRLEDRLFAAHLPSWLRAWTKKSKD